MNKLTPDSKLRLRHRVVAPDNENDKSLLQKLMHIIALVWSPTHFDEPGISAFAERLMHEEMRKGLMLMAVLSMLIQLAALALYQKLNVSGSFFYTYSLLAALSLHVVVSARFVKDIRSLNLLGTMLLVITGVAIMAIAHQSGSLNAALLSSIVLLFMVMPLVPWGLRDAILIVALIYMTFTLSTLSVEGRFESDTLWTLQFLMFAAAATAVLAVVRNTLVRKNDIRWRYALEDAHRELKIQSTRDPLTGAGNRRYLEQNFDQIARQARSEGKILHLAVLDVDNFKALNDNYGHFVGDDVLCKLVRIMDDNLPGTAHVLRFGGDEFAVLDTNENFESTLKHCLQHLETDPRLLETLGHPVQVSVGFAAVNPDEHADIDLLYRTADKALYANKGTRRRMVLTGRWRIKADPESS